MAELGPSGGPAEWSATARELAEAIRRTPGFWLIPMELPDPAAAGALVDLLAAEGIAARCWIPEDDQWLSLGAELVERGRALPKLLPGEALVVVGRSPLTPDQVRGMSAINQMRDMIIRALDCPLIWCGTRGFLLDCWQAMPDFWSVRGTHWRLAPHGVMPQTEEPAPAPERATPRFPRDRELNALLLALFTPEELRRLLHALPGGDRLIQELPSRSASNAELTHLATLVLASRGLLNGHFFDALIRARPGRAAEIRAVAGPYMGYNRNEPLE